MDSGTPKSNALWLVHFPVPFCPAESKNHIDHRIACFRILLRENISSNLDQVAIQLAIIPFGENFDEARPYQHLAHPLTADRLHKLIAYRHTRCHYAPSSHSVPLRLVQYMYSKASPFTLAEIAVKIGSTKL